MGLGAHCMILMADGSEKRAEDVAAGDLVREASTRAAATVRKTVNSPGVGMVRLVFGNGSVLDLTGDHRVATESGLTDAEMVAAGAGVNAAAGLVQCAGSTPLLGDYMVYDLFVEFPGEQAPRVFANGIPVAASRAR